jgi:oligopeptide transport system substrate-binding protein
MKFLYAYFALIILTACQQQDKRMIHAGGSFNMAMDYGPSTFDPVQANDYYSSTVLSQVVEGLVSTHPVDLTIIPQLAGKWEISEDGKTYRFLIRKGVYFHEHSAFSTEKERLLTVDDVMFSFERMCLPNKSGESTYAYSLLFKDKLKGSTAFFKRKAKHLSGLRSSGDTVVIELNERDDFFLTKLSHVCAAVISQKAYKKDGSIVGTGPFIRQLSAQDKVTSILLKKNAKYYERDAYNQRLPYLDSIRILISDAKNKQIKWFNEGAIDYIGGLSPNFSSAIIEGRIKDFNSKPPILYLNSNPHLTTNFYMFNMQDPRFADARVRQAMNFAIDRKRIGKQLLGNQYYRLGNMGIIPPVTQAFKGYSFKTIQPGGYFYAPELAKQLMRDAGYEDGKSFGKIVFRVDQDELNSAIAKEIQRQLKNVLGLEIQITYHPFEDKNTLASKGKGDVFRNAWTADYPSPETFLLNFYSKLIPSDSTAPSTINQSRYRNQLFDQLYEQAIHANNKGEALSYFNQAEVVLLQNPPFIPLWYSADYQIIYSNVRNLHFNPLNFLVLKRVYKKAWTIDEYRQKKIKP